MGYGYKRDDDGILAGIVITIIAGSFIAFIMIMIFGGCRNSSSSTATSDNATPMTAKEKALGIWKGDKHTIEFTSGSHAIVDGKFTYYDFSKHSGRQYFLHLGRKKTNEFTFEIKDNELILVMNKRCGWQTDKDEDDDFTSLEGKYTRLEGKYTRLDKSPTVTTSADKLEQLKIKLAACEKQHKKLSGVLTKMDADKAIVVEKLKNMGVKSKDDVKTKAAQILAKELNGLVQDRDVVRKNYEELTYKIEEIGATLRRIERQATVEGTSIPESELDEMLVGLNDSATPKAAESLEVGETLDRELGKKE